MRLTPVGRAAGALSVGLTSFPGVLLRFGGHTDLVLPVCGCDACDDLVQDLRGMLRFHVEALVSGGFAERGSADGSTGYRFVAQSGSSSGSTTADAAVWPGDHREYDHEWAAWTRR